MEPLTAVITSGVAFVVLFVATIVNFARTGKNMMSNDSSMEDFGTGFALHAIFGGLAFLSFLALVGSGIWLAVARLGNV